MYSRARVRNRVYRRIKNNNEDDDDNDDDGGDGGVVSDKLGHEFAVRLRGAWRRDADDARKVVVTPGGGTGAFAAPSRANVGVHSRSLPRAAPVISRARILQ